MKITGKTRLYAIIGDPIAQVRSPEVYTERFAALGRDAILIPAQVPESTFDSTVRGLMSLPNLDGLLVTLPHKSRMASLATRIGETGTLVGAVNALRREPDGTWTADMFDGAGMVRAIERKGTDLHGRRGVLFGCGGAGSAIAVELARAGVASLHVVDPSLEKAGAMVEILRKIRPDGEFACGMPDLETQNLIVNASPVGMDGSDALPARLDSLAKDVLVADVILSQKPTALIAMAQAAECAWVDGRDMHSGQIEQILEFFFPA